MENGDLFLGDLRQRKEIFKSNFKSPLNSCLLLQDNNIAFGNQNGELFQFDLKYSKNIKCLKRNSSPILNLSYFDKDKILATTSDGSCLIWNYEDNKIIADLTGVDYDHIYQAEYSNKNVYTCSRDGKIRKYIL
jgi:WD40 repeat protein